MSPWPGIAGAAESRIKPVSYTTGRAGHQLKWLPARPSESGGVRPAQATEPVAAPSARSAQAAAPDAFGDPFEDSKKAAQPTPATKLNDAALEKVPPKPAPAANEPKLSLEPAKSAAPAQKPLNDQDIFAVVPGKEPECPKPGELDTTTNRRILEPIKKDILNDVVPPKPKPDDALPVNCPIPELRNEKNLWAHPKTAVRSRGWAQTTFMWKASALCHKPAYFEDEQLERYGHTWGPWLQPLVSGGHFFLTVPALPYIVGLYPPHECVYTLGYYRPGSCAPYTLDPLPLSVRAALAEGGVWTGMVFLIP